jgi:methylglutaconyl-CoA hydratase
VTEQEPVLFAASPEGVAVITLNRPDIHNAFNPAVIARLNDILEDLRTADGVRVVLVEAAGKSFSAGADLNWMKSAANFTEDENYDDARALARMLHAFRTLPQPTIALVHGAARAGGVGIVSACDIAFASKQASFAVTEVRLGLTPSTISPYLVEAIGAREARRWFLTGELFDAEQAFRIGLVHQVFEDAESLRAAGEELVDGILKCAPGAVHATKELIELVRAGEITADLREETARHIARQRLTEEGREGIASFLEKRKPRWAE